MPLQVEILENSFARIKPQADEFAASFYENLFAANPRVKPLFSTTDMKKQQKKLLASLVLIVESLRKPEVLKAVLQDLGSRHISYGAIPKYYPLVGAALLTTFEQYLKEDWTVEVKQAWMDAYDAITNIMFEGAGYPPLSSALETPPKPSPTEEKVSTIPVTPQTLETVVPVKQSAPVLSVSPAAQLATPTPQQSSALSVELLESSFAKIKPQAEEFAASFYENLFSANPSVKPLFSTTDMKKQRKKLISALVLVVESLRKPEVLKAVLQDLGARHVGYGTIAEYYPLVGEALLKTFETHLKEDWTAEVKQAWVDAYGVITNVMLEGAGYVNSPVSSQTVPASSNTNIAELAPINEEKFPHLQIDLINHKFAPIKAQVQAQIEKLTSVFKEGITLKQLQENLVIVRENLIQSFWQLPTWAIAGIAALVLIVLVLITDENSWLAKILESADAISVVLALILFIKEIPERRKQSHYQAWSIIDGAEGVEVSYARLMALQDLNKDAVSLRGVKVNGAKLEKIDLSQAELTEADFSKADLDEANFTRANLNRADLSFASLTRVNFSRANLSFAKLKNSKMASCNFVGANLLGADLSGTLLSGADFKGANLSAANLSEANLSGANLEDANLNGTNLEGAIMPDGSENK